MPPLFPITQRDLFAAEAVRLGVQKRMRGEIEDEPWLEFARLWSMERSTDDEADS